MPYTKRREGDKFCVYKKGADGSVEGKTLGCHDTEEKANKQIAALHASESPKKKAISLPGDAFKAVSETDDELVIENHIVLWGSPEEKDLTQEFFTKETVFDSEFTKSNRIEVNWEHGEDPEHMGNTPEEIFGWVDWKTAKVDDIGLQVRRVLNRRHRYMKWLETLIKAGLVGSSSQAVPHETEKSADGEIVRWPLFRDTLTVSPAESRMMTDNVVSALKALNLPVAQGVPSSSEESDEPDQGATQPIQPIMFTTKGGKAMDLIATIKALVPSLTDEQVMLVATATSLVQGNQTPAPQEDPPAEPNPASTLTEEKIKSILEDVLKSQKSAPPFNFGDGSKEGEEEDDPKPAEDSPATKAIYNLRFGEDNASKSVILQEAIGGDFRQKVLEQNLAFSKFLRRGWDRIDSESQKALSKQIFPIEYILDTVKMGVSVGEMKAIMVEADEELGGAAVPPNVLSEFIMRLPGLVAIRQAGARVVTLATGNSLEVPAYTGGNDRYVGALRGAWGNETKIPDEKTPTTGMETLNANVYTYKVRQSQSLVEDATNLVQIVLDDIIDVAALDEDEVFITGNGVGRPRGVLPGGVNTEGLTEKNTGDANDLTVAGLRQLKRGVLTQYRKPAIWIGNSDTFGDIEAFVATTGVFIFPDLTETDTLLARKVYETEVMPDVAANAYPLLFGDFKGYWILERMGMSIQRFQDSNTGPNIVEFHVRRRVGGRLVKPWMIAVQKVAA